MHKKISVLVTYDFEDVEYLEPVQAFRAARHSIINIEEQVGKIIYGIQRRTQITIDQSIDDASVHEYDALFIPGGFSPDKLALDDRFLYFVRNFADSQKPILSSSHGPHLLLEAGVIEGRQFANIQSLNQSLRHAGVLISDQAVVNDNNRYISSRSRSDTSEFIEVCLEVLGQSSPTWQ